MDRDDRVLAIVLAAEHLLDLAGLDFLIEGIDGLRELGIDGLARFGPLDEHGEVVALSPQRADQIAVLLEAAAALQHFLRFGLILPEVGRGGARLEAGQLFVGPRGFKDSSADRRRAWRDPRSGEAGLRRSASRYCTRRRDITSMAIVTTTHAYANTSPYR